MDDAVDEEHTKHRARSSSINSIDKTHDASISKIVTKPSNDDDYDVKE